MVLAEDLRQAVLQAALQGKLTEQLETDSDVDEMLEKVIINIKSNTRQNSRANRIESIDPDDIPYEIPSSWKWIRLGKIANVIRGLTFSASSKTKQQDMILVLRGGNIDSKTEKLVYDDNIYVSKNIPNDNQFLRNGDCLIVASSGTKSSIGKSCYIEKIGDEISFGGFMMVVRPHQMINPQLISYHIKQYRQKIINETVGYISNITNTILNNLLIPLPPAEEQQRIVDKINEIMNKIDEYEKIEKELERLKKEFPTNMKDALLQAAMQGKLTEQLESDSNVDELLIAIKKEKEELIVQKKIKKEKLLPDIEEENIPFDIPENWRWVRLKNIVYNIGQKIPDRSFSYIDIGSIDNIHQKLNNEDNIVEADKAPSRARKIVNYGDVLYATVRPYLHNMCIIDRNFKEEPIASTGFAVMTCCKGILNKFLLLYMLSPEFDRYANSTENAKGMAYPAINDDKFYRALIPLPPIEEQQRIVERLDALLPLCEELKEE